MQAATAPTGVRKKLSTRFPESFAGLSEVVAIPEAGRRIFFVNLGPFAKPETFSIGNVHAQCASCLGFEFVASRRFHEDPPRILVCTSCGAEYATGVLMQQVVRQVIAGADVALRRAEYLEGQLVSAESYLDLLLEHLAEAERLLRAPAGEGDLRRAVTLLNEIALDGPTFAVRTEAFNAIALASAKPGVALSNGHVSSVLGRIRAGLEEAKRRKPLAAGEP